jgi:hypothetical protein
MGTGFAFVWARRLHLAGVIRRPETDAYIIEMIPGITTMARQVPGPKTWADVLRSDPDLLDHEIWRLFEVEGRPRWASLSSDGQPWVNALTDLAATGEVPRARLIDATLGALASDFSAYNMRWYIDFHDTLDPSTDERVERAHRYLQLLRSRVPTVAKFGVSKVAGLLPSGCLDVDAVAGAVAALVTTSPQATSLAALKLLLAVVHGASDTGPIVEAAAAGLTSASPAVQEASLEVAAKVLGDHDEAGRALLRAQAEVISSPLRARLESIAGLIVMGSVDAAPDGEGLREQVDALSPEYRALSGVDAALEAGRRGDVPPRLVLEPFALPPPSAKKTIAPIVEVDELILVLGMLIEKADDPADIERALGGVSLLACERPDDLQEKTGPLRKRVRQLTRGGRWAGWIMLFSPEEALCSLVTAWLDKTSPGLRPYYNPSVGHFLDGRIAEVSMRVAAGRSAPLLALPTHDGGWIDAVELAHRVVTAEQQDRQPDPLDAVQALLRVSRWGRPAALDVAQEACGEIGLALRYALGDTSVVVERTALAVAACRSRTPYEDDDVVRQSSGTESPGCGAAGRISISSVFEPRGSSPDLSYIELQVAPRPAPDIPVELPTALAYAAVDRTRKHSGGYAGSLDSSRRWSAWVWPIGREVHFANGLVAVSRSQDWDIDFGVFLEPLLDPDEPVHQTALVLIWASLGAKSAGTGTSAIDALVAGIDDGRLDGMELGLLLAPLLCQAVLKPTRLAPRLAQVAATSPLHAWAVRRALEAGLDLGQAPAPRNLHSLLEVFHDLMVVGSAEVTNPGTRRYLEGLEGRSKTGTLAARLLAVRSEPGLAEREADHALAPRVRRAQRWESEAAVGATEVGSTKPW